MSDHQMDVDDANVADSVLQYMRDEVENNSSSSTTGNGNGSSKPTAHTNAADVAFAALKAVRESTANIGSSSSSSSSKESKKSSKKHSKKHGSKDNKDEHADDGEHEKAKDSSSSHSKGKGKDKESKKKHSSPKKKNGGDDLAAEPVVGGESGKSHKKKEKRSKDSGAAAAESSSSSKKRKLNTEKPDTSGVDPELAGLDDDQEDEDKEINQYLKTTEEEQQQQQKGENEDEDMDKEQEKEEGKGKAAKKPSARLQEMTKDLPDVTQKYFGTDKLADVIGTAEDGTNTITTTATATATENGKASARGKAGERKKAGKAGKESGEKTSTNTHHTKSKAFTPKEEEVIDDNINQYCASKNFKRRDFCEMIWSNKGKKDNFWRPLCDLFPDRSRSSLYKHVRRRYHIFDQRGKWTPEEDSALKDLCLEKEGQWSHIGQLLGRMPEDCRDRWRNYLKCGSNKNTAKWTSGEELQLIKIVNSVIQDGYNYYLSKEALAGKLNADESVSVDSEEMTNVAAVAALASLGKDTVLGNKQSTVINSTNLKEVVNWTVISEVMHGARSRIQIRYKWKNSLKKLVKVWFDKSTRPDLLEFFATIKKQQEGGVTHEEDLNWFKIYRDYINNGVVAAGLEASKAFEHTTATTATSAKAKKSDSKKNKKDSVKEEAKKDSKDITKDDIRIKHKDEVVDEDKETKDKIEYMAYKNHDEELRLVKEKLLNPPNAAVLKGIYDELKERCNIGSGVTNWSDAVDKMEQFVKSV